MTPIVTPTLEECVTGEFDFVFEVSFGVIGEIRDSKRRSIRESKLS